RSLEDLVPEARLEMAFELGEVEVRPAARVEEPLRVVEEVEAEVEEAAGDLLAVDEHVPLGEVPAAPPDAQHRGTLGQPVRLVWGLELDRPLDRVTKIHVSVEAIRPGGRV